jgi:hypothetical protein
MLMITALRSILVFVSQGFNRSKLVDKPRSWAEPEDGCALEAAEESGAGELDRGKNRKSDSYLVEMESRAFFEHCGVGRETIPNIGDRGSMAAVKRVKVEFSVPTKALSNRTRIVSSELAIS